MVGAILIRAAEMRAKVTDNNNRAGQLNGKPESADVKKHSKCQSNCHFSDN